jgi:hypothetical protein
MTEWTTTILAAVIAAVASVIAANISSANARRNIRGRILQDLEIAEKLPDDSPAKDVIMSYALNRTLLLPIEGHLRHLGIMELESMVPIILLVVLERLAPQRTLFNGGIVLLWLVLFLFGRWRYRRNRHALVQQYLEEQQLPLSLDSNIAEVVERIYYHGRLNKPK